MPEVTPQVLTKEQFTELFTPATFACKKCPLHETRGKYVLPKGNFEGKILIIGEAPGADEAQAGVPFVGKVGQILADALQKFNFDMNDILVTNVCMCRPPKQRQPNKNESDACLGYVQQLIASMPNLKLILLLGATPLQALLKKKKITEKRGVIVKHEGKEYLPMLHPANLLYNPNNRQYFEKDFSFAKEYLSDNIKTGEYICADTLPKIQEVLNLLEKHEIVAFDIETSSEGGKAKSNFNTDQIIGVSFCVEPYKAYYIPFISEEQDVLPKELKDYTINALKEILPRKKLVMHNGKFDTKFIWKGWGLNLSEPIIDETGIHFPFYCDTILAHHLIWQEPPHDLKYLSRQFPDLAFYETELDEYKVANKIKNYAKIPKDIIYKYAAADADATLRLHNIYMPELERIGLKKLLLGLSMPLCNILVHTEFTGIRMDRKQMEDLSIKLQNELTQLENDIYEIAGEKFLIRSKPQLVKILFDKLKLPVPMNKTETGLISTSKDDLIKIDHPIAKKIVEYGNIQKLLSTYIKGNLERLTPEERIHAWFNQHTVATGRLSSADPNLQNIPAKPEFRGLFVSKPGHSFIMSDFSQIELRVLAKFSQDRGLLDAFVSRRDIHSEVARKIFNVPLDKPLDEKLRKIAKSINFGICYGIQAKALSEQIKCDVPTAQAFINDYLARFPQVYAFQEYIKYFVHKHKYVKNLFDRVHHIPTIDDPRDFIRGEAERTALNSPVQGTAAEITNLSAVRIFFKLRQAGLDAKLVLTIHDELVYEVANMQIMPTAKIIYDTMRSTAENYLQLPVLVDQSINDKWVEPKRFSQARYMKRLSLPLRGLKSIITDYETKK